MNDSIILTGKRDRIIRHKEMSPSVKGFAPNTFDFDVVVEGIKGKISFFEDYLSLNEVYEPIFENVEDREKVASRIRLLNDCMDADLCENNHLERIEIIELEEDLSSVDTSPETKREMCVEITDTSYDTALVEITEGGVLNWTLPEGDEGKQMLIFDATVNDDISQALESIDPPQRKKKRRFLLFRWLKNLVIGKKHPFKQYKYGRDQSLLSWKDLKDDQDWKPLQDAAEAGERILLLFHGFIGGPGNMFPLIHEHEAFFKSTYGDRVILFNHKTVKEDFIDNASTFVKHWKLKTGKPPIIDVITRSRGALVYRQLFDVKHIGGVFENHERETIIIPEIEVGNVVMLAGPNEGTPIAQPENMKVLLNIVTNLLATLTRTRSAANMVVHFLSAIVRNKINNKKWKGIDCMNPDNADFKTLANANTRTRNNYYTVCVNSEPQSGILYQAVNFLADNIIFNKNGEIPNDYVVPTIGTHGVTNTYDTFEINADQTFDMVSDEIHHLNYFEYSTIRDQVIHFLSKTPQNIA